MDNEPSEVLEPLTLSKPMPISCDDEDQSVSNKFKEVKRSQIKADVRAEGSKREE